MKFIGDMILKHLFFAFPALEYLIVFERKEEVGEEAVCIFMQSLLRYRPPTQIIRGEREGEKERERESDAKTESTKNRRQ